METSKTNLDSIIQGINAIISENRCPLSEEKVSILKDCLNLLEKLKNENSSKFTIQDYLNLVKIGESMLRFFSEDTFEKLKDLL